MISIQQEDITQQLLQLTINKKLSTSYYESFTLLLSIRAYGRLLLQDGLRRPKGK